MFSFSRVQQVVSVRLLSFFSCLRFASLGCSQFSDSNDDGEVRNILSYVEFVLTMDLPPTRRARWFFIRVWTWDMNDWGLMVDIRDWPMFLVVVVTFTSPRWRRTWPPTTRDWWPRNLNFWNQESVKEERLLTLVVVLFDENRSWIPNRSLYYLNDWLGLIENL